VGVNGRDTKEYALSSFLRKEKAAKKKSYILFLRNWFYGVLAIT